MTTRGRHQGEQGFSVIEVIIAVMVLAIVASAVSMASVSSNRARSATKLQTSLSQAGSAVQNDVASDRSWMATCVTINVACSLVASGVVQASSLVLEGVDGSAELVTLTATPRDSDIDGIGALDKDGVTPDFYRIVVVIRPTAAVATRFGTTPPRATRRFETSIDRNGERPVGALTVEMCRAVNQVDERMTIQGCPASGSAGIRMAGCPPSPRAGCGSFSWLPDVLTATEPTWKVVLQRVPHGSIGFTLRNANTGQTWSSASAVNDGLGNFTFRNLPAGDYNLVGLPSAYAGNPRWPEKESPKWHGSPLAAAGGPSVTVEPGVRNRALVMFKPPKVGRINLFFRRTTDTYRLNGPFSKTEVKVAPWAPTDGYQGVQAANICAMVNANKSGSYTCYMRDVGQNCKELMLVGTIYYGVGLNNGDWYYDNEVDSYKQGFLGDGVSYLRRLITSAGGAPTGKYCTFYDETYYHTYYATTAPPIENIVNGAVAGATYYVEPKPDNRVLEPTGAPPPNQVAIPISQCTVVARGQCSGPISGMSPGLNTTVMNPAGDVADAAANRSVSGNPAWWTAAGMWVYRTGAFRSAAGTFAGANPTVTLIGTGECYWTSTRYSGKHEGPCNPCAPIWQPGGLYYSGGACSLLTRTTWVRRAIERYWDFDYLCWCYSLNYQNSLPTRSNTFNFDPPFRCTTMSPIMAPWKSCVPTIIRPPVIIPVTLHRSATTAGDAVVNQVVFSPGTA